MPPGRIESGSIEFNGQDLLQLLDIAGEPLLIKGTGKQTRDLLFVEDCADFVVTTNCRGCIANQLSSRTIRATWFTCMPRCRSSAEICR